MEPHKDLGSGIEDYRPPMNRGARAYFKKAHEFAQGYYGDELKRIGFIRFDQVGPNFFFMEYIWVVHATGFSAKAVGKFMAKLVEAYGSWDVLADESFDDAFSRVKLVCNNPQKAKAIWKMAGIIRDGTKAQGFAQFRDEKLSTPDLLATLPYIGKVTCFHLGRNIGLLDCVKPDLHLIRLAQHFKLKDCTTMCKKMGEGTGLPLGIVDLIVWYAASTFGTLDIKKEGQR